MMSKLSTITYLIWFRAPKVNLFYVIEASKSIKYSSLGSIDLLDLMTGDAMSILVKG